MEKTKNYIGGKWRIPKGKKDDAIDAISYLEKFKKNRRWISISDAEMNEIFSNIIRNIKKREKKLIETLKLETRKTDVEAQKEIQKAIETFRVIQNQRYENKGMVFPSKDSDALLFTSRMPVGICVILLPWNFPTYIGAQHIAPALFCRNPLIIKPSPLTLTSSKTLFKVLLDSKVPRDMICLINGEGEELQELITDPRVDMVSFTGSSENAKKIGEKRRGRKFIFEGGGHNFMYVSQNTNIPNAVKNAITGCTELSGQKCVSTNVVLVQKDIFKKFESQAIKEITKNKKIAPLINADYAKRVHEDIKKAEKTGANIKAGGELKEDYLPPTLISLPKDHELMDKELFAPVLRISQVENLKEAIDVINRQEYGLSSAIFTDNPVEVKIFYTEVETGLVTINSHTGGSEAHIPFGGMKLSGNGFRLGNPKQAINAFSEIKTVKWNM